MNGIYYLKKGHRIEVAGRGDNKGRVRVLQAPHVFDGKSMDVTDEQLTRWLNNKVIQGSVGFLPDNGTQEQLVEAAKHGVRMTRAGSTKRTGVAGGVGESGESVLMIPEAAELNDAELRERILELRPDWAQNPEAVAQLNTASHDSLVKIALDQRVPESAIPKV